MSREKPNPPKLCRCGVLVRVRSSSDFAVCDGCDASAKRITLTLARFFRKFPESENLADLLARIGA